MYGIATARYFFHLATEKVEEMYARSITFGHIPVCAHPNKKNCNEQLKSFPRQQLFSDGQSCKLSDAVFDTIDL